MEIARCEKVIGKQDQYIAAYGGLKYIQFNSDESVFVDPIICLPQTRQAFSDHLLMLYTGIGRSATQILIEQSENVTNNSKVRTLVHQIVVLAEKARDRLVANDLNGFGEILNEGWTTKRQLASQISNPFIDDCYERALKAGALGGKLLGAGGGGFLLLFAPPERHEAIIQALPQLRQTPVALEPQGAR